MFGKVEEGRLDRKGRHLAVIALQYIATQCSCETTIPESTLEPKWPKRHIPYQLFPHEIFQTL